MTKNILVLSLILFSTIETTAQSVVYYPFNSVLGLSSNPNRRLWLDLKFQTNSYFSSLSSDISPEINLNNNPKAKFYTGGGVKLNYLNLAQQNSAFEGYFLNFGFRSAPFEKYKKIQLAFEVSPYASKKFDIGIFRTNFGIGYNFSK